MWVGRGVGSEVSYIQLSIFLSPNNFIQFFIKHGGNYKLALQNLSVAKP